MSWRQLINGGTWSGAAVAAALLLVGMGVEALMLLRGMAPESGRVAVRRGGDGALPRALAVSACVYGALWLTALTGESPVRFGPDGIAQTCAVWGGGLLAAIPGAKRKRKKTQKRPRQGGSRRKRAVT